MPKQSLKQEFPAFYAFGDRHKFLVGDEAISASTEARIRSVWPYIVRRVLRFQRTLKVRERANFDPEDTLTELVTHLIEKDSGWKPWRGSYITYAGSLVKNQLCSIRDRSRTVHSPRNSQCRMKEYDRYEAEGIMTERRRKTAEQVRRTANGVHALAGVDRECDRQDDPAIEAERKEADDTGILLMRQAIRRQLNPFEAAILGMSAGLWGMPKRTIAEIAVATRTDAADVKRAKAKAYRKLRDFIVEHAPSLASEE